MVKWISHRGLHDVEVENTKAAFDAAIKNGFHILETDLRLTKDGHVVLCHDQDLKRLGGPEIPVGQLTREELSKIELKNSAHLMFFDQFVDHYAAQQWVFDVKPESARAVSEYLKAWAEKNHCSDWLMAQASFLFWKRSHQNYFKTFFPKAKFYARKSECYAAGICFLLNLDLFSGLEKGKVYSIPVEFLGIDLLKRRFVEKYHRRGAKVLCFLPNDSQAKKACLAQVDEIITNHRILP